VQQLARDAGLTEEICVRDFGIRSYDLAYEIADGYEVVILVDAVPRGEPPGTLFVIEPDPGEIGAVPTVPIDAHALSPVRVLQMARSLSRDLGRIYLVGCEPAVLMTEDGRMGLSQPVAAAVPQAIELIREIIGKVLDPAESALGSHKYPLLQRALGHPAATTANQ